jgi:hypothetical protein
MAKKQIISKKKENLLLLGEHRWSKLNYFILLGPIINLGPSLITILSSPLAIRNQSYLALDPH